MVACSSEENFENSRKFLPERWLNEKMEFDVNVCKNSSIVVPFGCGRYFFLFRSRRKSFYKFLKSTLDNYNFFSNLTLYLNRRTCPGKKLSEMELVFLIIKLVREFKIEYISNFEQQFEFILAPRGPVNIKFESRA